MLPDPDPDPTTGAADKGVAPTTVVETVVLTVPDFIYFSIAFAIFSATCLGLRFLAFSLSSGVKIAVKSAISIGLFKGIYLSFLNLFSNQRVIPNNMISIFKKKSNTKEGFFETTANL